MTGDTLDLVLLAACVLFGFSGYRQGFVVGLLSFVGFLGGGFLGAQFATPVARHFGAGTSAPLIGLIVVFASASIGQLVATTAGGAVRKRLVWRPLRQVDSAAGAGVSVVSLLLVAWLVGQALAHSPFTGLATQVRHSTVLTTVDGVMPDLTRQAVGRFRSLMSRNGFPEIFSGLGPERVTPIDPPDPKVLNSKAVRAARADIVKIRGEAPSCRKQLEGSGFVYAAERVMTNAHVVAGVRAPVVEANNRTYDATVVVYDYKRDIAVLYVPGLRNAPLSFAGAAARGDSAIVAGYPLDGPFSAVAARVRSRENLRGPDIYQSSTVTREIYSLRARIFEGNSGGPLLAPDGRVFGVIFAKSVDDKETGYALTAGEVKPDADAGRSATGKVSTRGCD